MSRRAKLIFTSLFLVLVGAILAGVFLAWAPQDPLRFTVIAPAAEDALVARGEEDYNDRVFYVTVENVTGKEVVFYGASIGLRSIPYPGTTGFNGPYGFIHPVQDWSARVVTDPVVMRLTIPPHGTVRSAMFVDSAKRVEILRNGGGEVAYEWTTRARLRWSAFCVRLQEYGPSRDSEDPLFNPMLNDITSLELPPK